MATGFVAGDIAKVQLVHHAPNQEGLMVLHYSVLTVGALPATDHDLASTVGTAWGPNIIPNMDPTCGFDGTLVSILNRVPLPATVNSLSGAAAGIDAPGIMSKQSSGLVTWYTNFAGRRYRGRNYIPFPSEGSNAATGTPNAGYITHVSTGIAALLGITSLSVSGRTANVALSVYHRATHDATFITTFLMNLKWATQRRRGDYGRPNIPPI